MAAETDSTPSADNEERSSSVPLWLVVFAILALGGVVEVIIYGYLERPGWIGVADKKFWDYLALLVVPAALAGGVAWLNWAQRRRELKAEAAQRKRELEVENQRAQDAALQAYLDQMSQLLTDKKRPLHEARPGHNLSTVARARTLTVLPRLDGSRKRIVLEFLYEANLIRLPTQVIDLGSPDFEFSAADLSGADLRGAFLRNANLSGEKTGVNLTGADLTGADLIGANLSNVTLKGAELAGVILSDVSDTSRRPTILNGADLSGVRGVTNEELEQQTESIARMSLEGATMPNGQKYEDWLKSKGSGEDGENASPS